MATGRGERPAAYTGSGFPRTGCVNKRASDNTRLWAAFSFVCVPGSLAFVEISPLEYFFKRMRESCQR